MRREIRNIEGNLELCEPMQLDGMVTGDIDLSEGAALVLNGMCCGDLTIVKGTQAKILGMVNGTVRNRGGDLEIHGMVLGDVLRESGTTQVAPGAVVRGRIR